jgi:hypothetical protein
VLSVKIIFAISAKSKTIEFSGCVSSCAATVGGSTTYYEKNYSIFVLLSLFALSAVAQHFDDAARSSQKLT